MLAIEDTSNALKALKQTKKDGLIATMEFLMDINFDEAKNKYKKLLVDELRNLIIKKYNQGSPQECKQCRKVYNIDETIECRHCFICDLKMCPNCIPTDPGWGISITPKGLLPVCHHCEIKYTKAEVDKNQMQFYQVGLEKMFFQNSLRKLKYLD